MHLLYLDESGKSGPTDYTQPWYVLGGLILPEKDWQSVETDLNAAIDAVVPPPRPDDWELHMSLIHHRKKHFAGMPAKDRFALVDAVFDVMEAYELKMIFVGIDKEAHRKKYAYPDPVEALAYRFMLERFNYCVGRQNSLGLVVADEQKEVEISTRKAHSRYRRDGTGLARIEHVIETPFFTPSHWSLTAADGRRSDVLRRPALAGCINRVVLGPHRVSTRWLPQLQREGLKDLPQLKKVAADVVAEGGGSRTVATIKL